jgi:hypothetical protein
MRTVKRSALESIDRGKSQLASLQRGVRMQAEYRHRPWMVERSLLDHLAGAGASPFGAPSSAGWKINLTGRAAGRASS